MPSLCLCFCLATLFFLSEIAFLFLSSLSWVTTHFEGWMGIWTWEPKEIQWTAEIYYHLSSLLWFSQCVSTISFCKQIELCLLCPWRCLELPSLYHLYGLELLSRHTLFSIPYSSDCSWSFFWGEKERKSVPSLTFFFGLRHL